MSGGLGPVRSVSVVIPAYNAADTLDDQLGAIEAQDAAWLDEVVVVDSCSTDDTAQVVQRYSARWAKVRLASADRPGANVARNAGVRATVSDAVLLCDADDIVAEGWAKQLFLALQDHDVVRGRYEIGLLNDAETIAARGSLASTGPPSDQFFGGLGGNCAFRRVAWEQLGGLFEHHYGSDDAEFFWRAHLAGLAVGYVDEAVVHYRLRAGMRALYRQQSTWAASRALVYKEFRGTPFIGHRRSLTAAAKAWGWLFVHLPDAFSAEPARRGAWVRSAAGNVGRVKGSIRHRVLYL